MICPCKDCKNKGCGAYHDQCTAYQEWAGQERSKKQKKMAEAEEIRRGRRNRSCW